jgi:predicted nucleotidyltransferase
MPDKRYILQKVKDIAASFDCSANVILYGSRARGEASHNSDWDFLILTDIDLDNNKKRELRKAVHLIELESDEVISVIIHSKDYWTRPQNLITPFYKNIERESIAL